MNETMCCIFIGADNVVYTGKKRNVDIVVTDDVIGDVDIYS